MSPEELQWKARGLLQKLIGTRIFLYAAPFYVPKEGLRKVLEDFCSSPPPGFIADRFWMDIRCLPGKSYIEGYFHAVPVLERDDFRGRAAEKLRSDDPAVREPSCISTDSQGLI